MTTADTFECDTCGAVVSFEEARGPGGRLYVRRGFESFEQPFLRYHE